MLVLTLLLQAEVEAGGGSQAAQVQSSPSHSRQRGLQDVFSLRLTHFAKERLQCCENCQVWTVSLVRVQPHTSNRLLTV